MAEEFWKSSPFGEDSIFHPSWEQKQKQARQIYAGVKITEMKVAANYLPENSGLLFPLPPAFVQPTNIVSSDSNSVIISVKVTVFLSASADEVKIALNKNSAISASKSISSNFQYEANFRVKVGKSLARIDQYNSQEFTFTATVTDIFTKNVSDTRSARVKIDTDGKVGESNVVAADGKRGCFCKKANWTTDDLKYIVTELRKRDVIIVNGKTIKDDKGKIIKRVDFTVYDDKSSDNKEIKDRLFYLNRDEKIKESEATYENFSKQLNSVFKTYQISTCLQKIHFIAQIYQESQRFSSTYENTSNTNYSGGDFYQGRGLIQITHDYNYESFYEHLNGKKATNLELKDFVTKVATNLEYAVKSAGWYWQNKNINKYADIDDVEKVSAAINYPALLENKVFNSDKIRGLSSRKKYYLLLKDILDYESCGK